ncbi:MAG: phosphotransacetylase [Malacoplasma sp.]|nr:phosphotransacetylase [Malacoplasma sp.]
MKVIESIKNNLKSLNYKPTIVFAEGYNKTIQEAANVIKKENIVEPVLIFNNNAEKAQFDNALNIKTIVIAETDIEKNANFLYELRKNKGLTLEEARKLVQQSNYLCSILVKNNENWGGVCGIEYTTKDTLRAALQVIKAKPEKVVNSIMIFEKDDDTFFATDIGLMLDPTAEELAMLTDNSIDFIVNKINYGQVNAAMLSYSTSGSGAGASVDKVKKAYQIYKEKYEKQNPKASVYGEMQFDAAVVDSIRKKKCPDCTWTDKANLFIFPNLDAGNIGYKIMQRLGKYNPTGPIIIGLNQPINDLSRGANIDEVVSLTYVTALQTKK